MKKIFKNFKILKNELKTILTNFKNINTKYFYKCKVIVILLLLVILN